MKRRPGTPEPALQRADAPTLALSTVRLDAARLRQLLVFERTLRQPGTARVHGRADGTGPCCRGRGLGHARF